MACLFFAIVLIVTRRFIYEMKKIVIIGSAGAGKSTLARQLGDILQIEVIHLDSLFWRTGWKKISRGKQKEIQRRLVRKESWIMDGSYHATLDSRINAADTVIFLDMPLLLCIWRVIIRHFTARSRPDLPRRCQDKLDLNYLVKVGNFPWKDRECLIKHIHAARESGKEIVWLRSESEVANYLRKLHEEVQKEQFDKGQQGCEPFLQKAREEVRKKQRQLVAGALVSV
jgi:adenylate kinase family enzyme